KPDTDSQKPETPDSNTEDSAQISPTDKTDVTLPKTGQAVSGFTRLYKLSSFHDVLDDDDYKRLNDDFTIESIRHSFERSVGN
ncbi:hypothetical protein PT047_08865, partial [Erysipelothrix rhusiopathiae]|nr:hypothetical protein [Erysipelothrix rhusiopathiae]